MVLPAGIRTTTNRDRVARLFISLCNDLRALKLRHTARYSIEADSSLSHRQHTDHARASKEPRSRPWGPAPGPGSLHAKALSSLLGLVQHDITRRAVHGIRRRRSPGHRQHDCCHDNADEEHLSEVSPSLPFAHVPPRLLPMGSVVALTNPLHGPVRRCGAVVVSAAVREPCGSLKSRGLPGADRRIASSLSSANLLHTALGTDEAASSLESFTLTPPTVIQSLKSWLQGRRCPGPASSRTKGISRPARR